MTPKKIQQILQEHFPNPEPPLDHTSTYTLLIAVLLSAQCTDKRVNMVTPGLFSLANTPETMANQSPKVIEDCIKTCGLAKTKAQAIVDLSRILIDEYSGCVPNTLEDLQKLPGVGRKTAQVVLAQAFDIPSFPVDTHIHRCAKRWGLSNGTTVLQTEKDLKKAFPKKDWNTLHLQIIYFARAFCPAKKHDVKLCPICSQL